MNPNRKVQYYRESGSKCIILFVQNSSLGGTKKIIFKMADKSSQGFEINTLRSGSSASPAATGEIREVIQGFVRALCDTMADGFEASGRPGSLK